MHSPPVGRPSNMLRQKCRYRSSASWLEAPQSTLIARAEGRRDDASDANADVIRIQQQQGTGVMTWQRVEATPSSEMVLESTAKVVHAHLPGVLNDAGVESRPSEASRLNSL